MLAIYTRLSSDDDKGNSIKNQTREGKEFAKLNGFVNNFEVYNEGEGISGRKEIEDRPQLDKLMKDIAVGSITTVWMRNQNRLERNSNTFHLFAATAKKAKIDVYFGDKGLVDYNDPNGFLQSSILSALNTYQAELTGLQVKKVLRDNVSEGKIVGGIPFGYKEGVNKILEVCPNNSLIVKGIFDDYLNGIGTTTIAKNLNKSGVPTLSRNTKKWVGSTVLYILKNELYIGNRKYGDEVYKVPSIIDQNTFKRVQKKIESTGTKKGRKTAYKYLLNSLVKCGCCGESFLGRSYSYRGYFYYKCNSQRYPDKRCSNRSVKRDNLDDLIWNSLFNDSVLFDEVKKMYREGDSQQKKKELEQEKLSLNTDKNKLQGRMNRIKDAVEEDFYSISEGKNRMKKVESQMLEIQDKLERLNEQINSISNERKLIEDMRNDFPWLTGGEYREEWEKAGLLLDADVVNEERIRASVSFNEKQKIIQKYIENITLTYLEDENEFDVEVSFKLPVENQNLRLGHNLGRKPRELTPKDSD